MASRRLLILTVCRLPSCWLSSSVGRSFELQRLMAPLREIARLKGGPGRPNVKPSGMERRTEPVPVTTDREASCTLA
jgi:hypothetical protein